MAMRKAKRQELRKCREVLRVVLNGVKCFFCKGPILPKGFVCIGNADGSPIDSRITFHHKNENHKDNRPVNLKLSHTCCHKAHHMKRQWKQGKMKRRAA